MDPLSQQTPSIIDFFANELYFNFLVHVDFLVFDETGHQHVRSLQFHKISAFLPVDALPFQFVTEPSLFLLEAELSDVLLG